MKPAPIVEVTSDTEALALNAARFIAARFSAASTRFSVSLSGGATPKRVYELLAVTNFTPAIDWQKIHLFWGDERFVPPDHRDSNFRMAQEALLDRVPIPGTQVHPIPTSYDSPERAAISYETSLQEFYQAKEFDPARPLFDLTLLGLGEDGHTASLFPNTKALEERNAWVTSTIGAKPEPRISLTYPALESSREILFIVSGAKKQQILSRVLANDPTLPAARLETGGIIRIFADQEAMGN
ncbi:MAG TPA: 6-phosphogluconolactonase [Methylocella sp.]|nr:6-phosphogluconolactonase [Methylocella sp.]